MPKYIKPIAVFIIAFSFFSQKLWASIEMVKTDVSGANFIEISTGNYSITTAIAGSNASLSELKTSTISLVSGYLSQIPSISLLPQVISIEGGQISANNKTIGLDESSQPEILFTNDISTYTISTSTIKLMEIFDHSGNAKSQIWQADMNYDFKNKTLKFNPASGTWPMGSIFEVNLSSSVKDSNLLSISGTTVYFTTLMNCAVDNTIPLIETPQTKVYIQANDYEENFFVALSTSLSQTGVKEANEKLVGALGAEKEPVKILSIAVYNSSANNISGSLTASSKIIFSYDDLDENDDGFIDALPSKLKTKNFSLWRLNENKNLWVRQSGYEVDTFNSQVYINTNHFSTYALVPQADNEVTTVYAYPVPFRPNAGNIARYGSWNDGITFTNLPSEGKIRIYTISMELVKTLEITPNEINWDIKNSNGEIVASGIYVWEIVSGKNRKTGKLMVIK
ncbi:MAG: hypothetical protein L6420_06410 [Elusimicrobia bacterium]|nr:hypothetical protein [Elusimicrobiota bacterium]